MTTCSKCLEYYFRNYMYLREALSSVAIEHPATGKTFAEMLEKFLAEYHKKGHKE